MAVVRSNLVDFEISASGKTNRTLFWDLESGDSGYYAPLLLTPEEDLFTFGDTTAVDSRQHLKVFGNSSFSFEDLLAGQDSDWGYNDFITQVIPS